MLLSKRILHLLNFLKKQKNLKTFLTFALFYNLKKKMVFFITSLNTCKFFIKQKQAPLFSIILKISVLNNIFFNNILFKVFDLIKDVNLKVSPNFSTIKSIKKTYTVLRSPFVYKKSKTQLFFEKFKGFFCVNFKKKSIFIIDYLETVWMKLLVFPFSFTIFIKKKIYF